MASRYPAPFSSSRDVRSIDPFYDIHREMNRLLDSVLTGSGMGSAPQGGSLVSMPHIDVHEDEREICISAELPGVKPADVDLRIEGDMLTICGEKKLDADRKQENYHVMERGYGRFRRTIQLPFAPDPSQVRADCNQGVLTVRMPKQAQQERSRRIEVREGGAEPAGTASQGTQVGVQTPSAPQQPATGPGTAHH